MTRARAPSAATRTRDRLGDRDFLPAGPLGPAHVVPALAIVAIALGVAWRFVDLAYPPTFSFDEHHFVENARNYLRGAADWNDHPPLGKLLILPGLLLFGDNGFGWRIHAAILGVVHLALCGVVAAGFYPHRRVGLVAAALVAIDGMFVAYSRTALLDIPMNAFMMAALALLLYGRRLPALALAAVALGLAVAVKWIAVSLALAVPLLLRRRGRSVLHAGWMALVAVATYAAIVVLALALTGQPITAGGIVAASVKLVKHHAGFTTWLNPADSRWFTWPFLWKPIRMFHAALADGRVRITSSVGNPVLWYLATAAFAYTGWQVARALGAARRARQPLPEPVRTHALVLFVAVALLVQWIFSNRESYIWHYMASYSLGLMLLAHLCATHADRQPRAVGALLLGLMAVSVFYAPVWTNTPISRVGAGLRLFMPLWR